MFSHPCEGSLIAFGLKGPSPVENRPLATATPNLRKGPHYLNAYLEDRLVEELNGPATQYSLEYGRMQSGPIDHQTN
ncbi:MAG: hypothetical protein MAG451_00171 [Anaerolineales bacterium]|nr:hypothetical protein [Anaerolineales bacterium]